METDKKVLYTLVVLGVLASLYLMLSHGLVLSVQKTPPSDHKYIMMNIRFKPSMPEATAKAKCVYVGYERFKDNPEPTLHSGWIIIEDLPEKHVYQVMAYVDIWTNRDGVYTVEAVSYTHLTLPTNREV